ncbi:FxsA family protein [Glycomyces buryatensis]|uniref:FxsA family protein n=1 Tax=Glycomyces buryatensis TaxID=2570927 RepID=UPI0014562DC7|nr:FxsA family protein [Glycomyces buryatensis]
MTYSREPQSPPPRQRAPYPVRLALAAWVILEAAAFFGLVYLIGVLYTLMIFIGTSFIGIALVQYVGGKSFQEARDYLNSGGDPSKEPAKHGYALGGAVCLIVPGFVTDLIGLLLLSPPTRLLFRGLGRWIAAKTPQVNFGANWGARSGSVIDGEVIDDTEPRGDGGADPGRGRPSGDDKHPGDDKRPRPIE